jgi:hypothetical protein
MLALLLSLIAPFSMGGQYAKIKHISAETADGLTVKVWVEPQVVKFGQEVVIHYKIENHSPQKIYLVHESKPEVVVERGTISVGAPMPIPADHGDYDYTYSEIKAGGSYQGRLIIAGDSYNEARSWRLEVALGYVRDITGLKRDSDAKAEPTTLRGRLSSQVEVVWLSGLRVDTLR